MTFENDIEHYATIIAGCEDIDEGVVSPDSIYTSEVIARYGGQEGWWQDAKLSFRKALDQPLRGIPVIAGPLELINEKTRPIAESVLGHLLDQLSSHPDSSVKSEAKGLRKSIDSDNFDLNLFNKDSQDLLKALIKYSSNLIDKCKNKEITSEAKQAMKEVSNVNNKFNAFGKRVKTAIDKVWNDNKKR